MALAVIFTMVLLLSLLPLRSLLSLIGATAGLILCLINPWLIWVALGMVLPVSSSIALGPIHLTDLLLVAAFGLWFIEGARHRALKVRPTVLLLPLALYSGVLTLALLQATAIGEAVTEIIKWVQFAAILLIMPEMLTRHGQARQTVQWVIVGLMLGGVGQALLGIYQFIFRIGPEWFIIMGRFMRASGSFSQPNPYAGYLGLTFPIALSLTLWGLNQLWQEHNSHPSRQTEWSQRPRATAYLIVLFYLTATLLIGAALLASWSRGGWLGAAGSSAVVVLLRSRRALIGGAIGGLALAFALLVGLLRPDVIPQPVMARFQDVPAYLGFTDLLHQPLTNENFAIVERLAHWDAAIRMWEQAPWLGVGPGNYATIYPEVHLPRWEEALGHAHNIYLNTLAESGIWGLIAYLLLWLTFFIWLWRRYRQQGQPAHGEQQAWHGALIIGVIGMLCHLSIHNFFDNLFVQGMYLHIALWIALVLALPTQSRQQPIRYAEAALEYFQGKNSRSDRYPV